MTSPRASESIAPERLFSLDAYRGFVIVMMIFVNYIASMQGVPKWLKHASAGEDTFTFPDLVFPGFLFMVGMAIPLAFARRLDGLSPKGPMLRRLAYRFAGLLAVGVVYENAWRYDESLALIPKNLFYVLFYAAVIVAWFQGEKKKAWMAPAAVGVMLLLMVLYRGKIGDGFTTSYLEHSWWGILGLIGWGYALCSLLYLATRGSGTALMGCLALMLCLYMGETKGLLDPIPGFIKSFVGIGSVLGTTAANVMLGVIAGRWFVPEAGAGVPSASEARALHLSRIRNMILFAFGLLAAGWLLRPFHGINKINATESYTLVAGAINMAAFLCFYVLFDVFRKRAGAGFLVLVGTNALLAYILPDVWDKLTAVAGLGKIWWSTAWHWYAAGGMAGIVNAAAVTAFITALTVLLTRKGLRLKF